MKVWYQLLLFTMGIQLAGNTQVPAASVPAFGFLKADNTLFTTSQLSRDKKAFFVFFDFGCDHCLHAIHYLDKHQAEFRQVNIYLVTLEAAEKAKEFLMKHGNNLLNKKNILVLQDHQNKFIQLFKPRKYPSLFLYNQQGKLLLYSDEEQQLPLFLQHAKRG